MLFTLWCTFNAFFWLFFGGIPCLSFALIAYMFVPKLYLKHYLCYLISVYTKILIWSSNTVIEVYGIDNIIKQQHYVYTCNHTSYFDTPLIYSIMPYFNVPICKYSLSYIPIIGWFLTLSGAIFVDRKNTKQCIESLNKSTIHIKSNNQSVLLFPEGTRTYTGELQPFKIGGFIFAIQTEMPILPIAICGCSEGFGRNFKLFKKINRNVPIKIIIGKPIHTIDLSIIHKHALAHKVHSDINILKQSHKYLRNPTHISYSFIDCFVPNFV